MEVYETLEKALALIEREENWYQGGFSGPTGALCAEGACAVAAGDTVIGHARFNCGGKNAFEAALAALNRLLPHSVHLFNDSHSHAEVCDLFKSAIAKAKADAGIYLEIPTKECVEA